MNKRSKNTDNTCQQCERKVFANKRFCYEHFHEYNNIPIPFCRVKEITLKNMIQKHLMCFWKIKLNTSKKLSYLETVIIPDMWFEINGLLMLIEIDEYQHKGKLYRLTEKDRQEKIASLCDHYRYVVMLRINPDTYTSINQTRMTSIWNKKFTQNESAIETYTEFDADEFNRRSDIILNQIDNILIDFFIHWPYESKYFKGCCRALTNMKIENDTKVYISVSTDENQIKKNFILLKQFFDATPSKSPIKKGHGSFIRNEKCSDDTTRNSSTSDVHSWCTN